MIRLPRSSLPTGMVRAGLLLQTLPSGVGRAARVTLHKYWASACPRCPMRARCTTASYRRITRWEHEDVLERMQMLLDARPQAAVVRKQTVEHVFGTLKSWLGTTPLLTKTLPKVRTEISLAVLAYNMKRMIKIMGAQGMVRAIAA